MSIAYECTIEWLPPASARLDSALPADLPPWDIPRTASAGLARLFGTWLDRCGGDGQTRLALALWLGPEWIAEVRIGAAEPIRHQGVASDAHHLLFRLLESAARALGHEVPASLVHGFDDLRTDSAPALLAYLGAEGEQGGVRRRALIRAFELDRNLVAARLALAEDQVAAGDTAAAAALLQGCEVHDPERARELGLACWSDGEAEAALQLLGAAVSNDADDGLAHAALAVLLARQGETQEAFLLASRATTLIADDYRSWAAMADVHLANGEHQQAAFYYNAALRLAPDAPHLLKNAAACQLAADRPEPALELIERALAAAPQDAENHANLALARRALGDLAGARLAAARALALAPDDSRFTALSEELKATAG